jgi:hypothetical protein
METFADLKSELQKRLMSSSSSSSFSDTRLGELINSAYRWAASLFPWDDLKRAKETVTVANQEYYDYPEEFQTNSVFRLTVDGEAYKKISFPTYLEYKDNNESSTDKLFSEYGRQLFIYPTPTQAGLSIVIWGIIQPAKLISGSDKTFFYNFDISANEAIVNKALSTALLSIDPSKSAQLKQEAFEILSIIWNDMKQRDSYSQPQDKAFFEVNDFYK